MSSSETIWPYVLGINFKIFKLQRDQLSAAGLFKYVWPFSGYQRLNGSNEFSLSLTSAVSTNGDVVEHVCL